MADDIRETGPDDPYEPPTIEDLQVADGPSVTAAGTTITPGAE
jgi:hypothetical protein